MDMGNDYFPHLGLEMSSHHYKVFFLPWKKRKEKEGRVKIM
jgi:hypothetical protein